MVYIALSSAAVMAFIGYIKWKVATHAITAYFEAKGHSMPDDAEISKYTEYAAKKLFRMPAELP